MPSLARDEGKYAMVACVSRRLGVARMDLATSNDSSLDVFQHADIATIGPFTGSLLLISPPAQYSAFVEETNYCSGLN